MITVTGTSKGGSTRFTFDTEAELDAILAAFARRYPNANDPIAEFAPQAKRRAVVLKHRSLYLSGGANYYRQELDGVADVSHECSSQRTERIMFRVTPAERDALQRAADEAGVKLGQYIRSKIL